MRRRAQITDAELNRVKEPKMQLKHENFIVECADGPTPSIIPIDDHWYSFSEEEGALMRVTKPLFEKIPKISIEIPDGQMVWLNWSERIRYALGLVTAEGLERSIGDPRRRM
jgi:hypothetical protein